MPVIEASVWFEFGNLNKTLQGLFVPREEVCYLAAVTFTLCLD